MLNEQLHTTETNLRQAQSELEKVKRQNATKAESTKWADTTTTQSLSPNVSMAPPQPNTMSSSPSTKQVNPVTYNVRK